jgi:hypothetical protein
MIIVVTCGRNVDVRRGPVLWSLINFGFTHLMHLIGQPFFVFWRQVVPRILRNLGSTGDVATEMAHNVGPKRNYNDPE